MKMSSQVKRKSFIFTWVLENISYCWRKESEFIASPTFAIRAAEEMKLYLKFYPVGLYNNNCVVFYLCNETGPFVRIDCELALLSEDGSVLTSMKQENCVGTVHFNNFKEINEIFVVNRSAYLSDNKLTVRCRIWKSEEEMTEDARYFARTRICIKREGFLWNIRNFSSLPSEEKPTYQIKSFLDNEVLMSFNLLLKNPYTDENSISIQLVAGNGTIKYFEIHIIPLNGLDKASKEIKKEFIFSEYENEKLLTLPLSKNDLIANKNLHLPNDVLSFRCECTFSTENIFGEIESVVYDCDGFGTSEHENHCMDVENTFSVSKRILSENLKSLFENHILSDVKLKTGTETFPAHKNILSARSPVFQAMFENDMKEKISECVDIEDLDSDTVRRMLHYIYTAEINDLQWDKACELYRAADKYEILALRDECSAHLKSNLYLSNACEALILADTHHDDDLKISAQDFIFNHDVMNSDGWKLLMETHLKLACETMYLQIQRKSLNNKLNTIAPGFDTNIAETPFGLRGFNLSQSQSSNNFSASVPGFNFGTFSLSNFAAATTPVGSFNFTSSTAPRKVQKVIRRIPRKD